MRRILLAVDATAPATAPLSHLLAGRAASDALSVVVLNAQPRPQEWQTRGLFREAIRDRLIEYGHSLCEPVATGLAAAGVRHHVRVELDDAAAAIVRCAREEGCSEILIAAPRLGLLKRAVLQVTRCVPGSVAGEVVHLSDIPVTVVH